MYKSEDLDLINKWMLDRNQEAIKPADLPAIGIVIGYEGTSVAIGFIRIGEGLSMLEDVVTNPDVDSRIRDEALNHLFEALLTLAKQLKSKRIIGWTVDAHTQVRALQFGFKPVPHMLLAKDII